MDPNMTPTTSRNRSTRAGTSQDEHQFSQFQGLGYIPQPIDPNSPFQPFPYRPHLPFGGNIPFQLTPEGMIASGMRPTYFEKSSTTYSNP